MDSHSAFFYCHYWDNEYQMNLSSWVAGVALCAIPTKIRLYRGVLFLLRHRTQCATLCEGLGRDVDVAAR